MQIKLDLEAYNQAEQAVCQISEILFERSPVSFTFYSRLYRDGQYIGLYSNADCFKVFLENFPNCLLPCPSRKDSGISYYFSKGNHPSEATEIAKAHNVVDVLNIIKPNNDYIEKFGFGCEASYTNMLNFYAHNLEPLLNFTHYFSKKASPLFNDHRLRIQYHQSHIADLFLDGSSNKSSQLIHHTPNVQKSDYAKFESLTSREEQCLKWLFVGKERSEIAEILGISVSSVGNMINNLKKKLDCKNRAELIEFTLANNLVSLFL